MPHIPYRARPVAGQEPPPASKLAPLAKPPAPEHDDVLDLPVAPAPKRPSKRPPIVPGQPRPRGHSLGLERINPKTYEIPIEDVHAGLFEELKDV